MDTNGYYALLAPVFLALVGLELLLARSRGLSVYRFGDTLSNLLCGLGQILWGLLTAAFLLALYDGFFARFAIVRWPAGSWIPYVLGFVGVDLCYYTWHRAQHRVGLFWAIHAVHHQSEEVNVSVGLRQAWFSDFSSILFYWPLPLLGVHREAFFFAVAGLSLYQVLLHTRVLDYGPRWGTIFNTPGFHRLHHAREDGYRDHNFGSTLIVWDRLFGTFARERPDRAPSYGTVEPFGSLNPLWAQAQPFLALLRASRAANSGRALLGLWLGAPARPDVPARRKAVRAGPTRAAIAYALIQFLLVGASGFLVLRIGPAFTLPVRLALLAVVLWGSAAVTAILEEKPWARRGEWLRVPVTIGVLGAASVTAFAR